MDEYSRIVIEKYCLTHKTKKSEFLSDLLELSYTLDREPTDWEAIKLEQYIEREKNPGLRNAMDDLDEFLFRY